MKDVSVFRADGEERKLLELRHGGESGLEIFRLEIVWGDLVERQGDEIVGCLEDGAHTMGYLARRICRGARDSDELPAFQEFVSRAVRAFRTKKLLESVKKGSPNRDCTAEKLPGECTVKGAASLGQERNGGEVKEGHNMEEDILVEVEEMD